MAFYDSPGGKAGIAIVGALLVGYVVYTGEVIKTLGLPGLSSRSERVEVLRDSVATLQGQTDAAKRELARSSIEDIRARVDQYRSTLTVLREFVPDGNEVPNLLDAISTRAKIRGVNLSEFRPRAVEPGPSPFDTYAYQMAVIGRYDQIGEFLSDVASLRRIMVSENVTLTRAAATEAAALGDTTSAMLEATFQIRTYVKSPGGSPNGS